MNSLQIPQGAPGINVFATPGWWDGVAPSLAAAGVVRSGDPGADVLTWPDETTPGWSGRRTLLVVEDLRSWLRLGSVAEMSAELTAWADAIVEAGADTVLSIHPGGPTSLEELTLLAAGVRAPYADVEHPAPAPSVEDPVVSEYDEILAAQVGDGTPPSWVTRARGRLDAVTSLDRSLAAVAELSPEDAAAVRAASRAALAQVEAVVRVVGPREALLWPAPLANPRKLPLDVAVAAAVETLRAVTERRPAPLEGTDEIDRLELELMAKQRELNERRRASR